MRILYVDDNDDLRERAKEKLTDLGHTVTVAADYKGARECLDDPTLRIQVVISDHMLAGNEGFNFILGLQQAYPNVKLCILSQELTRSEANQLTMAGIIFFQKPVLLEKVVKEIKLPPPAVKKTTSATAQKGLLEPEPEPVKKRGFTRLLFPKREKKD